MRHSSADAEANPALIVWAPLSTMRVRAGGAGPEDLVRREFGAILYGKKCGFRGVNNYEYLMAVYVVEVSNQW
jgi:hypothetical protein